MIVHLTVFVCSYATFAASYVLKPASALAGTAKGEPASAGARESPRASAAGNKTTPSRSVHRPLRRIESSSASPLGARRLRNWLEIGIEQGHSLNNDESGKDDLEDRECPSLFATIFSKQDSQLQRSQIRSMWESAGDKYGSVKGVFAICSRPALTENVVDESSAYGDLLVLDCDEGYLEGLLTRKVARAMEAYLADYSNYDLYMKIDDDTFISPRRLGDLFMWRESAAKSNDWLYAGVFAEGPHEQLHGKHFPVRDVSSQWYEPYEKFDGEIYPMSAKGGPGYILSRNLVEGIVNEGIADQNELNNEDKAVGVWVDKLVQQDGASVDYVNIPGTDGYPEHAESIVTTGTYRKYPHALHHHLAGPVIACLHDIEASMDLECNVDHCFSDQ